VIAAPAATHTETHYETPRQGQWLPENAALGGMTVRELRLLYTQRVREAVFTTPDDEKASLHAIAMMQKAHFDDFDD
jgi:hypothetical protein